MEKDVLALVSGKQRTLVKNDLFSIVEFEDSGEKYLIINEDINVFVKGDLCLTLSGEVNVLSKNNCNIDAENIFLNSDETKQIKIMKKLLKEDREEIEKLKSKLNFLEENLKGK